MGKFDKTDQQFTAEAFARRFPLEKAWSDAAREAAAESRSASAKGKQSTVPTGAGYDIPLPDGTQLVGTIYHFDKWKDVTS